jgi:hypothetical protein
MLVDRLYDVYMNYISATGRWEVLEKSVQLSILPWIMLNRWLHKHMISTFLSVSYHTWFVCCILSLWLQKLVGKLHASWKDFITGLNHRGEFTSIEDLISTHHVE